MCGAFSHGLGLALFLTLIGRVAAAPLFLGGRRSHEHVMSLEDARPPRARFVCDKRQPSQIPVSA